MTTKEHLIIVPCHSVYTPDRNSTDLPGHSPTDWVLESFQKEGEDHLYFIKHISIGIETLKSTQDDSSILIFSGGQTKKIAGPKSEAYGYYQVAQELGLLNDERIKNDVYLEEFARDSFENVLFSIARFHEITSKYPKFITIVGFEFKRTRFLELHLKKALRWDDTKVKYIGIDPKPKYQESSKEYQDYYEDLKKSEKNLAVDLFSVDLLGNGERLGGKKQNRNPFKRNHGYIDSNPALKPFFGQSINLSHQVKSPWEL